MSIVATEFPQQNLGIDDFLFTCIVVPTSLSGNEIPTKWRGNEIPINRLWELYTIYNPAPWTGQHGVPPSQRRQWGRTITLQHLVDVAII